MLYGEACLGFGEYGCVELVGYLLVGVGAGWHGVYMLALGYI